MLIETEAFILKKIEFGDYDFIGTFYTEKIGKISLLIKNARKSKKRYLGKLEPFNLISLKINYNNNDFKNILNSIDKDTLTSKDLDKKVIVLSSLVNEYLDIFEIDEVSCIDSFILIKKFFIRGEENNLSFALDSTIKFQVRYLKQLGLKPSKSELERIEGKKVNLNLHELRHNDLLKAKLIKILVRFSEFHSGKEFNSTRYLELLWLK